MKRFALTLAILFVVMRAHAAEADGAQLTAGRHIVVTVENRLQRPAAALAGALPAYSAPMRYVLGAAAAETLAVIEREHGLQARVAAWPITALGVYCVVYEVEPGQRERRIEELSKDPRVQLVQPLQEFNGLGQEGAPLPYNDPYLPFQRGFIEMEAARAHRTSTGRDVSVAIVDTGVDRFHPDLQGRIGTARDLAGGSAFERDRHGTAVAGIIAANANNAVGIAGLAPGVHLDIYRACWQADGDAASRCNSFTLAKALAAVLESDARIVNLSLGGPPDPLLQQLVQQLLKQGRIVVAALPPSDRREGFPAGIPGVIVVGAGPAPFRTGIVAAPGRDVLTLTPGGHYDFSTGSSMAAAHVTAIAALLVALQPKVDAAQVRALLDASAASGGQVSAAGAVRLMLQRH